VALGGGDGPAEDHGEGVQDAEGQDPGRARGGPEARDDIRVDLRHLERGRAHPLRVGLGY